MSVLRSLKLRPAKRTAVISALLSIALIFADAAPSAFADPDPSDASISGTVSDSSASPLADVNVAVFNGTASDTSGGWLNLTTTLTDGSFTLAGLPAGTYKLEFTTAANYLGQ
jgi:hypothetical protein